MPLEAATSQDVLVENRAGWRAGCHMSVFCKSLRGAPTALPQLKCPLAPCTTLCVSTSISQASDSLLYLRDISFYPLPPSLSPETCASLLFCHDGTDCGSQGTMVAEDRSQACLVHFCIPRHSSCHAAEHGKYLSNEAMNLSPFSVLPHNC